MTDEEYADLPAPLSFEYQIIPVTEDVSQQVFITLGGQATRLEFFTKSVNVPLSGDLSPPRYENTNPVFLNLFVSDVAVLYGTLCRVGTRLVRDSYLGFVGDLAIYDTWANANKPPEDPQGVSRLLPPYPLRNYWQKLLPLSLDGKVPDTLANKIPGFGTRWIVTYWPLSI